MYGGEETVSRNPHKVAFVCSTHTAATKCLCSSFHVFIVLCNNDAGTRRLRCNSCNTKIRRYRAKQAAVIYAGGKCNRCGWVGEQAAFDFHHPDNNKEFNIGNVANRNWELILKEIDKCELLCSNCHRINHSSKNTQEFLLEASKYKGRIFASVAQSVAALV